MNIFIKIIELDIKILFYSFRDQYKYLDIIKNIVCHLLGKKIKSYDFLCEQAHVINESDFFLFYHMSHFVRHRRFYLTHKRYVSIKYKIVGK